ncbi:predicted protein [Uncinocarpus reesii 1704]|uniref:Uncharacterized protein n=1 Tax=Uncinocarpus reesii (strain UAMH 1704) TaxID=336963 RepID=C4JLL2_UNCRE|nr:uncharacterized protein UREG_03720 [Uncinocarpus reesii 1704]EEP78874.1 predicted protein [Uncinocarpus reesii 1704]
MFRRKRSVSHGPINPNPSPSAQTAAVQAFRASQAANANAKLSSSAAAAALRKHTPTPTSIEEVQTRRMIQRQQSVSSIGASKGNARDQDVTLRRSSSLGSMSKRTFRETSPGPNALARYINPNDEIDPVPPLPQVYTARATSHRRAVSSGPTAQRTISAQHQPGRTHEASTKPKHNGSARSKENNVAGPPLGLQRRSSRSSINFSYPINARPNSPRQPSIASFTADGASLRTLSPVGSLTMNSRPPKCGSKNEPKLDFPGPNARGISPRSTSTESRASYTREMGRSDKPNKLSPVGMNRERPHSQPHTRLLSISNQNSEPGSPKQQFSTPGEGHKPQENTRDGVLYQETYESGHRDVVTKDFPTETPSNTRIADNERCTRNRDASPATASDSSLRNPLTNHGQLAVKDQVHPPSERLQGERPPSLSPTRSTRFSERLEIVFPGEHLHEPPSRSKSPAKSALKSTGMGNNVTSDRPLPHHLKADTLSESDGTSVLSDEGSKLSWKRKSTKVSFEGETEVVGALTSPPTSPDSIPPSSPQLKWNDSLRSRCNEADDFDEVMKPRPALPSFGSIRGRKRATEERLTIRGEHSRPSLADSVFADTFSNDSAIGGLLKSHSKQTKQTKEDASLPPEATLVEGTGSDTASMSESSSDEADPNDFVLPGHLNSNLQRHRTGVLNELGNGLSQFPSDAQEGESQKTDTVVPVISIQPATPMFEEHPKSSPEELDHIPGAFPGTSSQGEGLVRDEHEQDHISKQGIDEASAKDEPDDTDSESGDSVYSDAPENFSDPEGDGFGSINAIVSDSTPQIPRVPEASNPSAFTAFAVKNVDSSSQPSLEVHSLKSQKQTASSPTIQEETVPVIIQNGGGLDDQSISRPMVPELKLNGRPKTGNTSSKKPDRASTVLRTEPAIDSHFYHAISTESKNSDDQNPEVLTSLECRQTSSISPAIRNSPKFSGHNPTRSQTVSHSDFSRRPFSRHASNGSDSSSSFKRERRPRVDTGTYTLRRTMRNGFGHSKIESFDLGKSLASNVHHHRPFSSSGGPPILRTTLRDSGFGSHGEPPSSFSGFRSLRSKHSPGFDPAFRSRFVDSSDDEYGEHTFTPVRGIPRRKGEVDGDSTALEDSSDSDAPRQLVKKSRRRGATSKKGAPTIAAAAAKKSIKASSGPKTTPVNAQIDFYHPAGEEKPKKSVLSRLSLSRRRPDDEQKIRKSGLESAARRDTPLERSPLELDEVRNTKLYLDQSTIPATVTSISGPLTPVAKNRWSRFSPRSHRQTNKLTRHPVQTGSISWPLPAPEETPRHATRLSSNISDSGQDPRPRATKSSSSRANRPHTSDGVDRRTAQFVPGDTLSDVDSTWKSRFLHQRHHRIGTDSTLIPDAGGGSSVGTVALNEGRKKSRFPRLRKAFGLL